MKRWCYAHPNAVTIALVAVFVATWIMFVVDAHLHGGAKLWTWDFWFHCVIYMVEMNWIRQWWRRT